MGRGGELKPSRPFDTDELSTRIELEGSDPRTPIERAARHVILLRVPQRAAVRGVDGHAAVIPPAVKAGLLNAASERKHDRASHIAERICMRSPNELNAGIEIIARR